jgi:hypothetical protein
MLQEMISPAFSVKSTVHSVVKAISFFIIFLNSFTSFSQKAILNEEMARIAEELADGNNNGELELFIELLYELSEKPVKINSGDEQEIARIFFLTDFQVKSLAGYVKKTGRIVSNYEIAAIPGFDRELTILMIPFISLEDQNEKVQIKKPFSSFLGNLVASPLRSDSTYPGSLFKLLTRYKITAGNFEAGFTAEKDKGEKLFPQGSVFPDYFSGHISYSGKGITRTLIAGDFSARAGQGLGISTGMPAMTTLSSPSMLMTRDDLKPYTSTDENRFFRGIAGKFRFGQTDLVVFASHNQTDAKVNYDSLTDQHSIKSIYSSGLHNSELLTGNRDKLQVRSCGINLSRDFKTARAGILFTGAYFSLPFAADSVNPEKINDFRGKANRLISIYYKKSIRELLLFGELAFNNPETYALIQGLNLRSGGLLNASILYKEYGKGYTAFHSSAPRLITGSGFQRSLSSVVSIEPAAKILLSGGSEITWYPWVKYHTSFPSWSERTELRISYRPMDNLELELAAGRRLSMSDAGCEQGIPGQKITEYRQIRSMLRFIPVNSFTLTGRFYYKKMSGSSNTGMLFSQDLVFSPGGIPLTLWARYCIYNTDNWDSRLYIYENDLTYSFSMPAFSGRGARSYLMVKYEFAGGELRIKYGTNVSRQAYNTDMYDTDLRLQIRLFF